MEIIIVILGTLIIPATIIIILIFMGHKYSIETQRRDKMVNTMENIIEMKNKIIKQLRSFRVS